MKLDYITYENIKIRVYSLNTIIVGSGAAGLNAADRLYSYGQRDIAIVTEGMNMGTSRNTGSDKQTYYKLTLSGNTGDSVYSMAKTLFNGGNMDGDIAMVEAALSAQCFYRLVDIGVPFPHNKYGEFIGYKTDHDPIERATSAGPLTSRFMTERLEEQVKLRHITIFDRCQVIGILIDKDNNKAAGLIALDKDGLEDKDSRYIVFNCTNIIYATGGPAGIYANSVYPVSQNGSTGIAFEAGVKGKNLTESQFGIASVKFRWNLSGTYQQVLPRYISTDKQGKDEREFLKDYFESPKKMLESVFLKGYQWPFDPRKVKNQGSSLIDILVYNECINKGRRVFLDYRSNTFWGCRPNNEMDFSLLGEESYVYLKKSGALLGKPVDRLILMNAPAYELYRDHGIDLKKEPLEIAVCAQHNNGGLYGNLWWESNVKHFFPVGEVNGSHGVYRPGGSALNSGQVGSTRAAQYISARYNEAPSSIRLFNELSRTQIENKIRLCENFTKNTDEHSNVKEICESIRNRMSKAGAHIRRLQLIQEAISETKAELAAIEHKTKITYVYELSAALRNYDLLITQLTYLSAMENYILKGGRSRGSYLICDSNGEKPTSALAEDFNFMLEDEGALSTLIQEITYVKGICSFNWRKAVTLPQEDNWFENVWSEFRNDEIIK
jgi:succinate dehydrogenase/fumarate reductase flavoprotein subunit